MKGQELKHRITGIQETVKITKAMQMISASKMHKSQQMFDTSKKYLEKVTGATSLLMTPVYANHQFFVERKGDKAAFIVIAGEKGLCGDYNHVVLAKAYKEIQLRNVTKVFPIGYMARDYFKKRFYDISNAYIHLIQDPMPEDVRAVTDDLIAKFTAKEFDKLYVVYTDVETLAKHNVIVKKLLPIAYEKQKEETMILSDNNSISNMLNQYVWSQLYYAIASALLAINYKRMVAMQQSTTNGEEIISELILEYNHKRQESITTELVDASASLQGKRL